MLKQKIAHHLLPFVIIFSALFFAGFISFTLATNQEDTGVKEVLQVINTHQPTPQATPKTPNPSSGNYSPLPTILPTPISYPVIQPANNPPAANPTPNLTPSPTSSTQTNQINVTINGSSNFTVILEEGNNQCDVLTKALQQGKISSLNMQYNSTYNTYAVYQINGIGKENQVWWTYSVNGSNPPLGCSLVKAKNGDSVIWIYIGPN